MKSSRNSGSWERKSPRSILRGPAVRILWGYGSPSPQMCNPRFKLSIERNYTLILYHELVVVKQHQSQAKETKHVTVATSCRCAYFITVHFVANFTRVIKLLFVSQTRWVWEEKMKTTIKTMVSRKFRLSCCS